jgi:pyrimidine-nucleoside phosphorylase
MKTREAAVSLARRLVRTSRALGAQAAALVTDMSQPLGVTVGNALEVRESVEILQGGGPADVRELTLDLAATMLTLAGVGASHLSARSRAERALADGSAWRKWLELIEAQGGDPRSLENGAVALHPAPVQALVPAPRSGVLAAVDTFALGELMVAIGAGRRAKDDAIDPRVGMRVLRRIGDSVRAGEALAELHLAKADAGATARAAACFRIEDAAVGAPALVIERVG